MLPTAGSATVVWWKITDGKRPEALRGSRIFVEIFVEEKRTREEQEKTFIASLKSYGAIVSRREYSLTELSKKI